jgi:IS5 family transposase
MLQQLQEQERTQLSLVDADSRLMKKSTSSDSIVGYNVQSVVDAAHHLIVEVEATTQGNDFGQLNAMAQQARQQLGVEELTVVADAGYHAIADLREAEQQGIRAHVPEQRKASPQAGLLGKEAFRYDAAKDEYECPGGRRLNRHSDSEQRGQKQHVYYNTQACAACPLRQRCTTGRYRKIKHLEGQPWVQERIRERMKQQPEVYAQRKSLVEHPFGTIKFWWGQGAFLTRGLSSVQAEVSLSALAYNLRRALNILGVETLLRQLSRMAQIA